MKALKRLSAVAFAACALVLSANLATFAGAASDGKLKVTVTTTFLQDMVKVLAPEATEVQLIIPAGEDPHTYEAKPEDNVKLAGADLILYHGLHFEGKMIDLLKAVHGVAVSQNFDPKSVRTMTDNGMEVVDPHFWFDTDLYKLAVKEAAAALIDKLPGEKEKIEANLAAYLVQLDDLDKYVRDEIQSIPEGRRILVTPHDAFNYCSRRYGIEVRAPQGVSTDAELSNRDMAETADFIVSHQVKAIFAESTTDPARMEKLKESCAARGFTVKVVRGEGQELFSDSLAPAGQKGDTYIEMVKTNADLIASNLR